MGESGVIATIPIDENGIAWLQIPNKPEIYGEAAGKPLKIVCREPLPDDLLIGSSEDRIKRVFGGNVQ